MLRSRNRESESEILESQSRSREWESDILPPTPQPFPLPIGQNCLTFPCIGTSTFQLYQQSLVILYVVSRVKA